MRCTFLLIALFLQTGLSAQLSPSMVRGLDSIATQDVPKGAPGIATGIVKDGRIIYQKVAGFASLPDSMLITSTTRFNIASNGKQFTALAVLMLIDEKKLSLTDDIRKFLPGLYPGIKEPITIRHLLTHSSGIRDVYDLWSLQGITWWKQSFGNKDVISLLEKQQDLNFTPGSKYLYSNSNYILLATIVEKVTGRSFIDYTNAMFRKLGMHKTSFESDAQKIKGPIARAYFNFDTWTTYNWIWNVYGDGNIFSTLEDLLLYEQGLQKGRSWKVEGRSQQPVIGSSITNYGYGLEFGNYKGLPYVFHEGATGAWKATVIRFPEKKVSMVTLTNTGKATPNTQTRQMADVYFGIPKNASFWLTKPAAEGPMVKDEEIIGTYLTEDNFAFQFEQREGKMYLKRVGRNDVLLEREGANILHQTYDPPFKQEFLRNAKGELTVTAYYTSHAPYTLTRVNANFDGFDFASPVGSYRNVETDVVISMQHSGGQNYAVQIGTDSTKGLLVTPTKMLVDNYVLDFVAQGFLLGGDRIQGVVFRKE
ncbi:MAG: serine hydrolase domain-containing protein [Chitinophagaceae bacterium]